MSWRDLILNNFWWKMAALAGATGFWYSFRSTTQAEIHAPPTLPGFLGSSRSFVQAPVLVLKSTKDHRQFRVVPPAVDVTLNGDSAVLKSLSLLSNLYVFVAASGSFTNGAASNRVEINDLAGVDLAKADPAVVRLQWIASAVESAAANPEILTNAVTVAHVPVRWLIAPGETAPASVTPPEVAVRLRGRAAALEKISAGDILAFVNWRGPAGGTNLAVEAHVPPGVVVKQVLPKTVAVTAAGR